MFDSRRVETGDEGHSRARTSGNALGSNDSDSDSDSMLEFIDNEDEDEGDSWIRERLEGIQRRVAQRRSDLKIPFVVEGQDHFGQANHAPVLLEHMLDKRDGVLDVYDDKGVPSAVGSETKDVNESIPLRQIGELERLCCDGFYIRGFHSWDATEAAVGA